MQAHPLCLCLVEEALGIEGLIDEVRFMADEFGDDYEEAEYRGASAPNTYSLEGTPSDL